jgi:hypothetical protein
LAFDLQHLEFGSLALYASRPNPSFSILFRHQTLAEFGGGIKWRGCVSLPVALKQDPVNPAAPALHRRPIAFESLKQTEFFIAT